MAALTDEMLMVYADGLLEGEMQARVESLVNSNPDYLRRVEIFRATGRSLSQHFQQPKGARQFVTKAPAPDETAVSLRCVLPVVEQGLPCDRGCLCRLIRSFRRAPLPTALLLQFCNELSVRFAQVVPWGRIRERRLNVGPRECG